MHQALDGDGSTENSIIVRKNRCFQSKTAVFMVRVARLVCICAYGADRGSPPSSWRRQRSSALHLDASSLAPPKEISRNGIKPFLLIWSEWRDSNSRHPGPKPGALPTGPHPEVLLGVLYTMFLENAIKKTGNSASRKLFQPDSGLTNVRRML